MSESSQASNCIKTTPYLLVELTELTNTGTVKHTRYFIVRCATWTGLFQITLQREFEVILTSTFTNASDISATEFADNTVLFSFLKIGHNLAVFLKYEAFFLVKFQWL
jgi:hypothetical protein